MQTRLKCEKPDDIEFTLTVTMTAREWELLREQLVSKHPSWQISRAVDDLLAQARKIYWHDPEPAHDR